MNCEIRTFTGKVVNPLHLRSEDICIEDIAHALALCNRFAGHTIAPISVAQHSVYVAKLSGSLQGLLHDASEAYLGDVTKWLKHTPQMKAFREAEEYTQALIYQKFHCSHYLTWAVEAADRLMVHFEGKQGFGSEFEIKHPDYPPLTDEDLHRIQPWEFVSWQIAQQMFLQAFKKWR